MKLKPECCAKYKKKGKACKRCPLTAALCKKDRKRLLAKYRRRRKKARAEESDEPRAA